MVKSRRRCVTIILPVLLILLSSSATGKGGGLSEDAIPPAAPSGTELNIDPAEYLSDYTGWPFNCVMQFTGKINMLFDANGRFGRGFSNCAGPWPSGAGFETPSFSGVDYLFGGAVWVTGIIDSDSLTSTGADGWGGNSMELLPPGGRPTITQLDYPTDFSVQAVYDDIEAAGMNTDFFRPHVPMNIKIINRAHAFLQIPFNKAIIYDMIITNVGDKMIRDGYVGFYFDADVCFNCQGGLPGGYLDDLAGSLREHGIGYVIDNDGDTDGQIYTNTNPTRMFAFKFLHTSFEARDTSFNWWINSGNPVYNFGPRRKAGDDCEYLSGGFGMPDYDNEKYCMMSTPGWDYDQVLTAAIDSTDPVWRLPDPLVADQYAEGADTRFLMSIGPFDLPPDSSVRIMYTIFTGELVHIDPHNYEDNVHREYLPDLFISGLNFSDVISVAHVADYLADSLSDPNLPLLGLELEFESQDSTIVSWAPWVFGDVEGYELYVSEVPEALLPYPGLAPPWLEPAGLIPYATLTGTNRFLFNSLEPDKLYFVNVANRTVSTIGQPSGTLVISSTPQFAAPKPPCELLFVVDGEPALLTWADSSGMDIDHYNIYKFDNLTEADRAYHAFYSKDQSADNLYPADSFLVDGEYYYYFAMEPFAQVASGLFNLTVSSEVGQVYLLSAVNKAGFESEFSSTTTVEEAVPVSQEILIVTNTFHQFVTIDTIRSFYESILTGLYDFDIYDIHDTVVLYGTRDSIDWRDFGRYRLLIVDDDLPDKFLEEYEDVHRGFTRYLLYGGKIAYFGSLGWLDDLSLQQDYAELAPDHWFVQRFFGIDSLRFVGLAYYLLNQYPLIDTAFGFTRAEDISGYLPDISFDSTRFPFGSELLGQFWPANTAPAPVTFAVNNRAEPLYLYRSISPATSRFENYIIGVRSSLEDTETYLFGFHLWYMNALEARQLIETILPPTGQVCCAVVGDIDHGGGNSPVDIADLTFFVKYLYADGVRPFCSEEADINSDGIVDLVDLTILLDYVFKGGGPMPDCR